MYNHLLSKVGEPGSLGLDPFLLVPSPRFQGQTSLLVLGRVVGGFDHVDKPGKLSELVELATKASGNLRAPPLMPFNATPTNRALLLMLQKSG